MHSQGEPAAPLPNLGPDDLQNLLQGIEEFDKYLDDYKIKHDSEGGDSSSGGMFGNSCGSPGLPGGIGKSVFPNLGPGSGLANLFGDSGGAPTSGMTSPPSLPGPPSIPEPTGPAAETLKQMAAQHQNQNSPAGAYPSKSMDFDTMRNGSYPPNYSGLYNRSGGPAGGFGYGHQSPPAPSVDSNPLPPDMVSSLYPGTKPLSHFGPGEQQQQVGIRHGSLFISPNLVVCKPSPILALSISLSSLK